MCASTSVSVMPYLPDAQVTALPLYVRRRERGVPN